MKDIKGYEGLYAVTSCGKVWSYRRNKFLKLQRQKDGYLRIGLVDLNGRHHNHYIQRLVLETYNPVTNSRELEAGHIDEIRDHNWLSNLKWQTPLENNNYGTRTVKAAVKAGKAILCAETGIVYGSITKASQQTGINPSVIGAVANKRGYYKTAGGYHWEFI